jgi:ribosome biogenesis GTPase A
MDQLEYKENFFEKINWYPGHMHRAMRLIEERVDDVQVFFEIRDARVPFSSKNYHFDTIMEKY